MAVATKEGTLHAEAVECVERADGDIEKATLLLVNRLRVREDLFDQILFKAAQAEISLTLANARFEMRTWRPEAARCDLAKDERPAPFDRALAGRMRDVDRRVRSHLNEYIVGSKPLGECTADDLDRNRLWRLKIAATNSREARFLERVKAAMKNAATVRDALTDADLERLHQEQVN